MHKKADQSFLVCTTGLPWPKEKALRSKRRTVKKDMVEVWSGSDKSFKHYPHHFAFVISAARGHAIESHGKSHKMTLRLWRREVMF